MFLRGLLEVLECLNPPGRRNRALGRSRRPVRRPGFRALDMACSKSQRNMAIAYGARLLPTLRVVLWAFCYSDD